MATCASLVGLRTCPVPSTRTSTLRFHTRAWRALKPEVRRWCMEGVAVVRKEYHRTDVSSGNDLVAYGAHDEGGCKHDTCDHPEYGRLYFACAGPCWIWTISKTVTTSEVILPAVSTVSICRVLVFTKEMASPSPGGHTCFHECNGCGREVPDQRRCSATFANPDIGYSLV
jgi:hypothetical protein